MQDYTDMNAPVIDRGDIEHTIAQNERFIENAERLKRLQENSDFQALITEGYLKSFAIEQVYAIANPQLQRPEFQEKIQKHLTGIAGLKDFLDEIAANGLVAAEDIVAAREELTSYDEAVIAGDIQE